MEIRNWIKGLLFHVTLATLVFVFVTSGLERLIPGFVEPFLNLPMLLFAAFILALGSMPLSMEKRSVSAYALTALLAGIGFGIAGGFLWTRLAGSGASGIALLLCGILAGGLLLFSLFTGNES